LVEGYPAKLFTPVRSQNALEETVDRVAKVIKARLVRIGDQLPPERELAQQLGVSRSTLRAALGILVNAGYLEVRRGRRGGTFVARWPEAPRMKERYAILSRIRHEIPAILDFRRAIEPTAAELAAERATASEVRGLSQILTALRGVERNFTVYRAYDARFHVEIASAAKSPLILDSVIRIQTSLSEVLDLIIHHSEEVLRRSTEYHRRILEAIRQHRSERARHLMLDHILATENIIHGLVPEMETPAGSVAAASRRSAI
jgi:DNA-binding FadR family transcriptional regulator